MGVILITGASGLIGTALTGSLLARGDTVRHLSRGSPIRGDGVKVFAWDPSTGRVDPAAFERVDHIVHLSGASLADGRWTHARWKAIEDSRIGAARLLRKAAGEVRPPLKAFISASGINYYGAVTSDRIFSENDPPGDDRVGQLTREWEAAADNFGDMCRVVKLRTSVVLARHGGALPRMASVARWGLAAPLGTGRQYMPWVHLDDLVRLYLRAIDDPNMVGAFNVAASHQLTNREFMRALSKAVGRWMIPVAVPAILLKTLFDGAAVLLLEGSRASNEKLLSTGFRFTYDETHVALEKILQ